MPLPQPDRTLLAVPPLVVTLIQVKFEVHDEIATPGVGSRLLERAQRLELPAMTQIHHQQVVISTTPAEVQQAPRQPAGWQFTSKDQVMTLTVLTDQMTLETRAYRGWDAFAAAWAIAVDMLAEVVRPELRTRVGLRYVNRVTPAEVTTAADLQRADLVEASFLGPAVGSALSQYVTATEGRVALSFPDGADALVQHGVVTENGAQAFVLDIDCFRTQATRFSPEDVAAASAALNVQSLQVFQTVVREPLRAAMKRSEVSS
jgi:uncharacterized protein (TIGR04255 family)